MLRQSISSVSICVKDKSVYQSVNTRQNNDSETLKTLCLFLDMSNMYKRVFGILKNVHTKYAYTYSRTLVTAE